MIKAIAFDLGGVLIKEKKYSLSNTAKILEKKFGNINNDKDYFKWAIKATGLPKESIEKITKNIIDNIYELREPDIFDCLPKIKFAIASNHLSYINNWIDKIGLRPMFYYILISADINMEKPNRNFFEKLVFELQEKPEDILFVDDNEENIKTAKNIGLQTLLYNSSKNLTQEVLKRLNL